MSEKSADASFLVVSDELKRGVAMRLIWMNFRGCDVVEAGMPVTVIPKEIYDSPNYYYKNGLPERIQGKSGIVKRRNRNTYTIDFGGFTEKVDKVQCGLYVPYEDVCTKDGKIIHRSVEELKKYNPSGEMPLRQQKEKREESVDKAVCIIVNYYMEKEIRPLRTVVFHISAECLNEYLEQMEDDRDIDTFLKTYDSDEAEMVYRYAADDVRVMHEQIFYSHDFEKAYENYVEYIEGAKDGLEDVALTKEDYWKLLYTN